MLRRSLVLALLSVACSSSDDSTPSGSSSGTPPSDGSVVGDIRESITWEDGTKLGGVIRVVEGVTVTIAPGAKISCNEATQILLGGTLKVSAKDNHASISCAKWTGITVAKNGKLDIDGLDIENANIGYQTTQDAGECVVKNSKILTTIRPVEVGVKSKLTLDHVEASVPAVVQGIAVKSFVEVFGTLEAHYLKYEAQTNEGIMVHTNAEATITDSELTAHGGQDLISSYGAKSLNVSYTTMAGAHCGLHLQEADSAVIDRVTSTANLFGITIYGAKVATVTNSNLSGSLAWLDLRGDHGEITFDNNFVAPTAANTPPNAIQENTDPLAKDGRATEAIPDAAPRPAP